MRTSRRFRFALTVGHATSRAELVEIADRAEAVGFDVLAGVDHVGGALGAIPLLATLAEISPLRLSTMVLANDHRHPALLARDGATIDVLSGGRFELGLGTGWIEAHYDAIGLALDPPGVRVARLAEAIDVIRGCWSGERFAHAGEHYAVALESRPTPIQRPHPPLLVAGSGPRLLRLAGAEADIVSLTVTHGLSGFDRFPSAVACAADRIAEQLVWIGHGAAGRAAAPELNVMIHHRIGTSDELQALAVSSGVDAGTIRRSPHVLSGSTPEMVDALVERRERWGLSYVTVRGPDLDALAPVVERLAGT